MLTALAVTGVLCAATAASVYTAALPRRDLHAARAGTAPAPAWDLGAEAGDLALRQRAADRSLPHRQRLDVAWLLAAGACLQPREMLFGAAARRHAALDSLRTLLVDLPEGAETVANAHAVLRAFDAGERHGASPGATLPAMLLPDVLLARLALCRQLDGR